MSYNVGTQEREDTNLTNWGGRGGDLNGITRLVLVYVKCLNRLTSSAVKRVD